MPRAPHLATGTAPCVMGCDALIGEPVVDAAGENIGELAHLMLDLTQGRIAYGVVGRGGVLGLGEKLYAIPWAAFTLDQDLRLTVDITCDTLERAPGFDAAHWPSGDGCWRAVDRYYEKLA